MSAAPVLEVRDLTVEFTTDRGTVRPVEGVDLTLRAGEMLGLVGESGSGKSATSLAITGLTEYTGGRIVSGSVRLGDVDMLALTAKGRAAVLGRDVGMVFQQPRRSLNPTMPVGHQIAETVRRHRGVSRREAWDRAVQMLERVRIPDAARRAREYPFSFSGGMAQRVMIAMALACEPKVLIADEPTTALDATVQATVMELLRELQHDLGVAVLLITHDLGVAWGSCDRVAVMYCGQVVEEGPVRDLLTAPEHPYTQGLLRATPHRGMRGRLTPIAGSVPSPANLPAGCRFHPRCPRFTAGMCDVTEPRLEVRGHGRSDRCVHPEQRVVSR